MSRSDIVQGSLAAAVALAGVIAAALGSPGGAAAVAAAGHVRHAGTTQAASPAAPRMPETTHPSHHVPVAKLRHPLDESWSRLLAAPRRGWATTHHSSPLKDRALSRQFVVPSKARDALRFDGYRRGVTRATRSDRYGVIEQLWQFRRPTGAKAWYLTYAQANRPQGDSVFSAMRLVGRHGDLALTATRTDALGYHFGVGVALDGDMIVHVRVFGTRPVTRAQVARELRRAERPVARGITMPGLGPVTGKTSVTLAT